ncbi:hypothetical protein SKA58_04696 [Sphingomonas sp. SKA58]|nr:hypothetical protein SKA58_04696 [Sphingomonas sp. SKA58]
MLRDAVQKLDRRYPLFGTRWHKTGGRATA